MVFYAALGLWLGILEAFAMFELELLAFMVKGAEFLNAGEQAGKDVGIGIDASEFKGLLVEHLADGGLET